MNVIYVAVIGITLVAAVWDIATRRIPNVLSFGAALAGVLVHAYLEGVGGAGTAAAGWLVGAACFFPFFVLGGMGAGDVKLLAAIGAWLGPGPTVWVALYSAIAGGAMGLLVSLWTGYLTQAFVNILWIFKFWRTAGPRPVPELTLATHNGPRLAYAVPVFAGLMVSLWLR